MRHAIPGVAIHADVIVGFPTEDDAAWARSLAFIDTIGFAGIHVFRYSARPGTPALRMAGQVDEPVRKRRAGELLAVAAGARARFAADHVGREVAVLFESRLDDGRWVGHAEDHLPVAVIAAGDLENAIGRVIASRAVDPAVRDRVVGRLLAVDPPRRAIRRGLPLLPDRARWRSPMLPMQPDCLFCRIIAGELPADRSSPRTSTSSRSGTSTRRRRPTSSSSRGRTSPSAAELGGTDGELLGAMFGALADLADREGLAERGYRIVTNVGEWGGPERRPPPLPPARRTAFAWPPG